MVDAPARLKRELDAVLNLQADLDVISSAIHMAKSQLQASQESIHVIKSLESTHTTLVEKVEELYSSLNIHHSFPELKGIDLEFIRTLLLARDLKINIRKRAIGSFFEWERLDQAVGGQNQALGSEHSIIPPYIIYMTFHRYKITSEDTESHHQAKTGSHDSHSKIQQILRNSPISPSTRVVNPTSATPSNKVIDTSRQREFTRGRMGNTSEWEYTKVARRPRCSKRHSCHVEGGSMPRRTSSSWIGGRQFVSMVWKRIGKHRACSLHPRK